MYSLQDCTICKNKAKKGFINTICLDCKRQYIGQEAEEWKTDKFEPIKEEYLLKPCPFCNYQRKDEKRIGQIIVREKEYDDTYREDKEHGVNAIKNWYHIVCLKCKCKTDDYDTEQKAIDKWNMRGGK